MNKTLALILIVLVIFASGCASKQVVPVSPNDLMVSSEKIIIKEFDEQDVSVQVVNNNKSRPIESVRVSSFDPFTILGSPGLNIAAERGSAINFRIQAPAFNAVEDVSMMTLSYTSGQDKEGKPIVQTKTVPVQTVVLPNASLQFVGFAEGIDKLLDSPPVSTWDAKKGENVTVKFSVKNNGKTTIEGGTLVVLVDIENKQIGGEGNVTLTESMAKAGTSYTRGIELKLLDNAPNGESDVYVTLMYGDYVVDSQTILLKVKL